MHDWWILPQTPTESTAPKGNTAASDVPLGIPPTTHRRHTFPPLAHLHHSLTRSRPLPHQRCVIHWSPNGATGHSPRPAMAARLHGSGRPRFAALHRCHGCNLHQGRRVCCQWRLHTDGGEGDRQTNDATKGIRNASRYGSSSVCGSFAEGVGLLSPLRHWHAGFVLVLRAFCLTRPSAVWR